MQKISYSKNAQEVLEIASRRAEAAQSPHTGREHVALALLDCAAGFAIDAMMEIGISLPSIYEELHVIAEARNDVSKEEEAELIEKIEGVSLRYEAEYVGTEHILIVVLESDPTPYHRWIEKLPISIPEFVSYLGGELESLESQEEDLQPMMVGGNNATAPRDSGSILSTYGTNLTESYLNGEGDVVIGRDDEIERAIKILCRKTKNNPMLIGEAGVGKTAVAEGIAQRIANDEVPMEMRGSQIIVIDIFAMLGGTMYRGQFEDKVTNLMKEVKESCGNIILFIDEIHNIVGAGASNSEESGDLSNIMKPALARGELSCIGATTSAEYKKYIEKDGALERRFQKVYIDEPSDKDTFKILKGIRPTYCEYHNVDVSDRVLWHIIEKCKLMEDRRFPDKAIDLLDESCVEAHIEASKKVSTHLVKKDEEIDRLLVNAMSSNREGEEEYFLNKKIEVITETEKDTKGRVGVRHVNNVLKTRSKNPAKTKRIGF